MKKYIERAVNDLENLHLSLSHFKRNVTFAGTVIIVRVGCPHFSRNNKRSQTRE